MAIVSFDDVKSFLNLNDAALTDYPKLKGIFNAIQPAFEKYCSRLFDIEERTETFIADDINNQKFFLQAFPVSEVAEILIDTVATTDFNVGRNFITLGTILDDYQVISIRYTGGIVDNTSPTTLADTLPADLNTAAARQIAFEYQNIEQVAVKKQGIEGSQIELPETEFLKYTKAILDPYVNYGLKI